MSAPAIRNAAIVGIGESRVGKLPGAARAFREKPPPDFAGR